MSDTIENPKGGYVLKVRRFDETKKQLNSLIADVYSVSIEIPDFDLNEFFAERIEIEKTTNYFILTNYIIALKDVEKPLLNLYYLYKKKPKAYNKLIENEQKIDKSFFLNLNDKSLLPVFFKLKKIWEKYIPFPKLDNINFCHFFFKLEGTGKIHYPPPRGFPYYVYGLEKNLINREIILSFLKPYFVDYPIKEIPIEKTTVDISTQTTMEEKDNTNLKSSFLNKMSGNTIENPRGGRVLKVMGFDKFKQLRNRYKPNSGITDFELNEFISRNINKDSAFNFEEYLKLEAKAWEDFKRRYPYADSKLFSGEYYNHSFNIYFKHTPIEVIGNHPASSFYNDVKKALGPSSFYNDVKKALKPSSFYNDAKKALEPSGSFPFSLLVAKLKYTVPGSPFSETPASILNEFEIYVTPDQYFFAKFRNIFKYTNVIFENAAQCNRWLGGPNMSYWPQQLNFAVWCATSGCGISLNEKYPNKFSN